MRVGRYRFAPPWWGVVVLVLVAGALCSLGIWQIDRGESKQIMLAQQKAAGKAAPLSFSSAATDAPAQTPAYGHRYTVAGRVDAGHQILLDNQVFDQRVGYRVWTPIIQADGRRVLVDRGWVSLSAGGRNQPPTPRAPKGHVEMTGLWRGLPEPGLRLGADQACDATGWPRVLNYPEIASVRCQYTGPVADGLLLLDERDTRGFPRNWQLGLTRMPPIRHFGYAAQWFAMAAAVAVIFLVVNLKRIR
ncbi:SURF1 family protein [Salinisphaera aquimarina]|uniref:SURF1-like protein n=1 Tax=Salinisphaera aquimarina TaxID=2094031 RepID=A0ABV7EIX8_9GAMM